MLRFASVWLGLLRRWPHFDGQKYMKIWKGTTDPTTSGKRPDLRFRPDVDNPAQSSVAFLSGLMLRS
jgi:hypothetical protein